MKKRKKLSSELREEQIIKKAFMVFSKLGYRGSTTKMLANDAGINKIRMLDREVATRAFFGMIYFYFINQEFFLEREIKKFNHQHVINEFVKLFLKGTLK